MIILKILCIAIMMIYILTALDNVINQSHPYENIFDFVLFTIVLVQAVIGY